MIFIGTLILLTGLLVYLTRWVPVNRKIKTLIHIVIIIGFFGFSLPTLKSSLYSFRQHPFSTSDANGLLKVHKIYLDDDFELTRKKISGVMDYILEFELVISEGDRDKIAYQIKQMIDNQGPFKPDVGGQLTSEFQGIDTAFYFAYEDPSAYNLEYYHKIPNGYVRTQDFIRILKAETKLSFERWE